MPEDIFQFKRFRVRQAGAGMRITTDACVFGAYVARFARDLREVLDIGTGTGLLSLILAQSGAGHITALEINKEAFEEARFNFAQSNWSEKLQVLHGDARAFRGASYGTIICNPPFFDGASRSPIEGRKQAMHQVSLDWRQMLDVIEAHLSESGEAWVLLPFEKALFLERLAMQRGLYLKQRLDMAESPHKPGLRAVLAFGRSAGGFRQKDNLYFKEKDGSYTEDFRVWMQDYYLHL